MEAFPLPATVSLLDGAAAVVNPMTVVSFLEIAANDRHTALVNTAGNSALGRMLIRAGKVRGIRVLSVVRGEANALALRNELGHPAELIVRSDTASYREDLATAAASLDIKLAFDAIGGSSAGVLLDALPADSDIYAYGELSGSYPPLKLMEAGGGPVRKFHLADFLDAGGLPRVVSAVLAVRSMLRDELKTTYSRELDFAASNGQLVLDAVQVYAEHQTGGKLVLKIGGEVAYTS